MLDFEGWLPTEEEPSVRPPVTYRINPHTARADLDHRDMVTLSGMFRRWAIYELDESITPAQRTLLIQLSADYERIAEWVGPDWLASDPSEEAPISRFLAVFGRRENNVVDLGSSTLPKPGNRRV